MKKICTLLLTAGMLIGAATGASAIDFKASGQWIFSFGAADTMWNGQDGSDTFNAKQRVRLQIDAVASESLSGTVFFEIGDQTWGNDAQGADLGTDGIVVEVRRAYIDWYVPNTELSFRMGLQGVSTPNAAGGSMVLDDDAAAIVANYKFNDMVSLTAAWVRPLNDNYTQAGGRSDSSNYLDNMDLFLLSLPITGNNWSVNPWAMVGFAGRNTDSWDSDKGIFNHSVGTLYPVGTNGSSFDREQTYHTMWFVGLPMTYQMDAWNFEFDFNYGSVSYAGDAVNSIDAKRSGWVAKALVEYKMDWGTPGIYGWYGSGDDSNVTDGSEMMPFISPATNMTSFMGEGNATAYGYGVGVSYSYAGTWAIGARIKDVSFMEDLSHTFAVTYWRGTNSADQDVRQAAGNSPYNNAATGGFYLTTNDYLVEITLDNDYQIYENLSAHVEFGYIVNGIDEDTWGNIGTRDGYKANLTFNYSF